MQKVGVESREPGESLSVVWGTGVPLRILSVNAPTMVNEGGEAEGLIVGCGEGGPMGSGISVVEGWVCGVWCRPQCRPSKRWPCR